MSNLLSQASLVMIPSGYKEDVVYSVIPENGSGDLSFTRASNGTRVNSAGLVEVVAWNLLQYSEQFTNGVWSPRNGTFTDNFAVAPNGTTTAAKWQATDSDPYIYQAFTGVNVDYTATCWIKATGTAIGKNCSIRIGSDAVFTAMTGEWQQLTITANINGSENIGVEAPESATSGEIVYIWGAQLNIGSTAKPYFPTTDRLNVPRLTYQNGGGGCPSLLLEKQSTNLITYSEQIQNAAWNVIGGDLVVTGNAVISPDGTQNAGTITLANSANRYFVHDPFSITGGVAYTYSVWMKSASGNLSINMGGVNGLVGVLKTVTTEWQRFTYTFTPATTYAEYFGFDNRGAGSSTSGTLYFWGAQVEASSYATSYIVSTSSSATRVADVCAKTGIGALIGGTSGTVFFDIKTNPVLSSANYKQFCYYYDSASAQSYMYLGSTNLITTNSNWGSLSGVTALVANTRYKIALVYAPNDFALYVNGVSVATASSGTPKDNISLQIGQFNGNEMCEFVFNQYTHFPSRLTNAELASLTTI